eukprot:9987001-Alexandrium_andersonii.AAC.1
MSRAFRAPTLTARMEGAVPCVQALAKQHAPAASAVSVVRAKLLPAALYGAPVAAVARAPTFRLRSEIAK